MGYDATNIYVEDPLADFVLRSQVPEGSTVLIERDENGTATGDDNPEVKLFLEWLHKVKPGYTPDLFTAYGWGQGRLFAKDAPAFHEVRTGLR